MTEELFDPETVKSYSPMEDWMERNGVVLSSEKGPDGNSLYVASCLVESKATDREDAIKGLAAELNKLGIKPWNL